MDRGLGSISDRWIGECAQHWKESRASEDRLKLIAEVSARNRNIQALPGTFARIRTKYMNRTCLRVAHASRSYPELIQKDC